jgi:hypothetical protein
MPSCRPSSRSQMEAFLANLSKPEFAERCSATQMIQAVCFPLAVALRGRRHGWVSNDSAETLGAQVWLLFSFGGKTANSPGLLHTVERRYSERGLSSIFREIVGDGTLWMVLIATLGKLRVARSRNLHRESDRAAASVQRLRSHFFRSGTTAREPARPPQDR